MRKLTLTAILFALTVGLSSVARADTCVEVRAYAKAFNQELPVKADEITTIIRLNVDCNSKVLSVLKRVSVPTTYLDNANPLWKTTAKRGFEKLICSQSEYEALTAYGWRIKERLEFTNNKSVEHETVCSTSQRQQATTKNVPDYSRELAQLQRERQRLQAQIADMQAQSEYMERARKQQYNGCYSNCLLNNKAGSGFGNALGGMAQCANSCRPLLYGGAASQPNWGVMQNQLESIDCRIRQINERNFSASCSKF